MYIERIADLLNSEWKIRDMAIALARISTLTPQEAYMLVVGAIEEVGDDGKH